VRLVRCKHRQSIADTEIGGKATLRFTLNRKQFTMNAEAERIDAWSDDRNHRLQKRSITFHIGLG
jgi:hypothetical protein